MTPEERRARIAELRAPEWIRGLDTDTEFFKGKGTLHDQLGPQGNCKDKSGMLDDTIAECMKHGHKPHYTDIYEPSIADFPGDPKAFIPASEGRHHVKKVCESKGLVETEKDKWEHVGV